MPRLVSRGYLQPWDLVNFYTQVSRSNILLILWKLRDLIVKLCPKLSVRNLITTSPTPTNHVRQDPLHYSYLMPDSATGPANEHRNVTLAIDLYTAVPLLAVLMVVIKDMEHLMNAGMSAIDLWYQATGSARVTYLRSHIPCQQHGFQLHRGANELESRLCSGLNC